MAAAESPNVSAARFGFVLSNRSSFGSFAAAFSIRLTLSRAMSVPLRFWVRFQTTLDTCCLRPHSSHPTAGRKPAIRRSRINWHSSSKQKCAHRSTLSAPLSALSALGRRRPSACTRRADAHIPRPDTRHPPLRDDESFPASTTCFFRASMPARDSGARSCGS